MAKGIRSKWKIKMRNIKRVKNQPRELERLKKALATVPVDKLSDESIVRIQVPSSEATNIHEKMDMTNDKPKYNKFLLDEKGHYPVWLNKTERAKMKQRRTKTKSKKGRRGSNKSKKKH